MPKVRFFGGPINGEVRESYNEHTYRMLESNDVNWLQYVMHEHDLSKAYTEFTYFILPALPGRKAAFPEDWTSQQIEEAINNYLTQLWDNA